jgi:hypothetical protein
LTKISKRGEPGTSAIAKMLHMNINISETNYRKLMCPVGNVDGPREGIPEVPGIQNECIVMNSWFSRIPYFF